MFKDLGKSSAGGRGMTGHKSVIRGPGCEGVGQSSANREIPGHGGEGQRATNKLHCEPGTNKKTANCEYKRQKGRTRRRER